MPTANLAGVAAITFDCYGTLIGWESGALSALRPLLAGHGIALADDAILRTFRDLDAELCEPPYRPYRAVLAGVVEGFGRRFGFPVGASERELLAASLPTWAPFPDTVEVLSALRRRHRLAFVSNIDDDLFAQTLPRLGIPFDQVVTAEGVRSYKPALPIFEEALRRLGVSPEAVLHAAEGASEVAPARRLGCATAWVRRHGRSADLLTEAPDLDVPDLRSLRAALDPAGRPSRTTLPTGGR